MEKTKSAISKVVPHERDTHSKTYAKVGRAMFGQLEDVGVKQGRVLAHGRL